jgi:hypothetical protein
VLHDVLHEAAAGRTAVNLAEAVLPPPAPMAVAAPVVGAVIVPIPTVVISSAIRPAIEQGRVKVHWRRYVDARRANVDARRAIGVDGPAGPPVAGSGWRRAERQERK